APAKPGQYVAAYSEVVAANAAMWGAKEAGIFQKNGLDIDVRLIESSLSIGALVSGQVQMAGVGGSEALAAAVEGADVSVVGIMGPVWDFKLEVTPDIHTGQDLKGKKLAVSRFGSTSDTATRLGLQKLGLQPDKDVSLVQVGSLQARTSAMQSGAVQGSMTLPPDDVTLEDQGFHSLLDLADYNIPASNNSISLQGAWLNAHHAEAQKYVDSIVQSVARLKKDRPFALQVMQKYMKLDDQRLLGVAYDYYIGRITPVLPFPKPEQFATSIDLLSEKNPRAKGFDLTKLVDPSLVQSAADRGLDKG
ncbi:MAG TPA: ABC transporter substrate-binding protein, partial [Chloroflexota bacterium]